MTTGWTRAQLLGLLAAADLTPAQVLRVKGTDAAARGLIGADADTILAAMVETPILVERPIVPGPRRRQGLCRPVELVAETFAR